MWGKKESGRTVLVLDIENGSVGGALVHSAPQQAPKLFGETRVWTPIGGSVSGAALEAQVLVAVEETLKHLSEVAARLRAHAASAPMGTIKRSALFLAPPWGKPNLGSGKPDFLDHLVRELQQKLGKYGHPHGQTFTSAAPIVHNIRTIEAEPCLVCTVSGEVSELLALDSAGAVQAHATIPLGAHFLIRTLRTHGGLSEHEARSAARLPFATVRLQEPNLASARHFAGQFADAANELLAHAGPMRRVHVVSHDKLGDWFAEALASEAAAPVISELFPQGGEVRALRAHQVAPWVTMGGKPDLFLMLQALFVDSHLAETNR
jgi:hypothetical protein